MMSPNAEPETLRDLLGGGVNGDVALLAPERPPLSYAGLRDHVSRVAERLRSFGIGRSDRVAIVLPNGPELATAFVALAAAATAAPLNPDYKLDEFRFFLRDLRARAVIVAVGHCPAALTEAARELAISLIELSVPAGAPAGWFDLEAPKPMLPSATPAGDEPKADDIALLLHTSGTTARPKLVPLTHANLAASARHVREALALAPDDRCLNVMPLFHIHGLVGALLSSLGAGASVACSPGFNAFRFFAWMKELEPTWYTAVPSIHHAVLQRARGQNVATGALRLVRSSSCALPPRMMAELESVFRVPAVESYGMTEAAHQMAANPLPPRDRRPGSVGIAAGPEVRIIDGDGKTCAAGESGEVAVRGANVMRGYLDHPQANAESFIDGWFRTGDQGALDAGGYLTLSARLKEIINRGGEKVSPREVDEVLLDHPAIADALTFALPHHALGEEVAAAVVLRPGASAEARDLRAFAAERLADFKVPRKVLVVDAIPTGPTGKPQRIGLAKRLGLTGNESL
jgi:oxalate---CoA ligase